MSNERARHIRKDDHTLEEILDRLDARASAGSREVRRSERHTYRARDVRIELSSPYADTIHYEAQTRNISREGISVLLGNFVYPGSRVRLRLLSEFNQIQLIKGCVVRCRYLEGSGAVYEVGIKFDQPIDVAMFNVGASTIGVTTTRMLLVDDDPFQHRLLSGLLRQISAKLHCVENGEQALEAVENSTFDLILMDIDMPIMNGLDATRTLRQNGFVRPIVAITALSDPAVHQKCIEVGCTDCISKPLTRSKLERILETANHRPIISTRINEPEMTDLIDEFVFHLPDKVKDIESAIAKKKHEDALRIVRLIKGQAGGCGFGALSKLAAELEMTIEHRAVGADLRSMLNAFVSACLAARPATCTVNTESEPDLF